MVRAGVAFKIRRRLRKCLYGRADSAASACQTRWFPALLALWSDVQSNYRLGGFGEEDSFAKTCQRLDSSRDGSLSGHLSDLEMGKREIGLLMLQVIAKGLDSTMESLLRGL